MAQTSSRHVRQSTPPPPVPPNLSDDDTADYVTVENDSAFGRLEATVNVLFQRVARQGDEISRLQRENESLREAQADLRRDNVDLSLRVQNAEDLIVEAEELITQVTDRVEEMDPPIAIPVLDPFVPGDRVRVLNSNHIERFSHVTSFQAGNVYFQFEGTGRRTWRAQSNVSLVPGARCGRHN